MITIKQLNTTPMKYDELKDIPLNNEGFESQFFTWEGWDQLDTSDFVFYDCVLVKDLGEFPKGTKFETIDMMYSNSTMRVSKAEWKYNIDEDNGSFNIKQIMFEFQYQGNNNEK